jgi:hypothetical protein
MVDSMKIRQISVRWRNQRHIKRVYKWLNLEPDFRGMLYRKGLPVGYKTNKFSQLIFNFYQVKGIDY